MELIEEFNVSDIREVTKRLGQLDTHVALLQKTAEDSSLDLRSIMEGQTKILTAQNLITQDLVRIVAKQEEKDKRLSEYKDTQTQFEFTVRDSLKRAHARIDLVVKIVWVATGGLATLVWVIEHVYA